MKVYKKCPLYHCSDKQDRKCQTGCIEGYIETEIPFEQCVEALKATRCFIENGVENGYIRLPDKGTKDPALHTLVDVQIAIKAAEASLNG